MHWAYVAGYFDGEGNAGLYPSRGRHLVRLTWYNTHRLSLEAIRDFMGYGRVSSRGPGALGTKTAFLLVVSKRSEVIHAVDNMSPHLIIKREACAEIRDYATLRMRDACPQFGAVAALGEAGLRERYIDQRMSIAAIARSLGVGPSAVSIAIKRFGFERRPKASTKGIPKSPETIARMRESRRKLWQDPKFREAQLANLSRSRRISTFTLTAGNA